MEHRWNARATIPVAVTVYCRGNPMLTTTTRNLSRQGALLQGQPDALGSARSVELLFEIGRGKSRRQLRLPAYVIHRDGGIGLMFTDHSKAVIKEIDQLLQRRRAAISAQGDA